MTTDSVRVEVVHDTVSVARAVLVHDTVRETSIVTIRTDHEGTERSRVTENTREHLRNSVAVSERASTKESEVLSKERSEDKRSGTPVLAAEGGGVRSNARTFIRGCLAGIIATVILYLLKKKR